MNLSDPGILKAFLGRHGISAAKGLGQHFLCSSRVVEAIQDRLAGSRGLLEIGPGPGVLTGALSAQCERMIALEIDRRMIEALKESAPTVDVREADALKVDLAAALLELPEPRAVVSNLPYYITAPLVTRIAEARGCWSKAVLMMQREVADRILAPPGSRTRGSLSVYLQSLFEIDKVVDVPAGAFLPPPKVTSAVLEFRPKPAFIEPENEEAFFAMVRRGFKQPRKTLANNLLGNLDREAVLEQIVGIGLDERIRPQELTQDHWTNLFVRLNGHI